jgi:hypothetical protein
LALVSLAIKIQVNVQSPEFPDYEDFNIGLLFAPVIGSYGLASLVLGITESSLLRKEILPCLLPVFALLYIGLGFASWMVMNYGVLWFWRAYFGFILLPFLITHTAVLFYFTKKERLAQILSNIQTRTYAFIALVSVPLFYAVIFFFLFSIFT